MKMKRVLAILLASCLMLTLVACGGGKTTTTTTGGDTVTTTTVGGEAGVADPDVDVTTDPNATTTTVTDKDGNVVTTTTVKGATTTRKTKNVLGVATQTVGGSTAAGGQIAIGAPIEIKEGTVPCQQGKNGKGATFTYAYYGSSWSEKHKT